MKRRVLSVLSLLLLTSSLLPPQAIALANVPEPGCPVIDWEPLPDCNSDPIGEPGIGTSYSDLVGSDAFPAAFYAFDDYSDGLAHFRERVVGRPTFRSSFRNAAWVVLFDFDSSDGYEYIVGLSGKNPEVVALYSNPVGERMIPFVLDPTTVDPADEQLGPSYPRGNTPRRSTTIPLQTTGSSRGPSPCRRLWTTCPKSTTSTTSIP
jgi:hypothetical protein